METFTADQVREHLRRILTAPGFSDSVVLRRFLTFIVNETLEGRSHELKEYTIAIDALKKDPDFNPQIDSIVRIHAGRLRRALKEFYYEQGREEEMQIVVRKGSYVPSFVTNTTQFGATTPGAYATHHLTLNKNFATHAKPTLAILPFDDISEAKTHTSFIKGLDMYLSTALTNNPQLSVISYLSSNHLPENVKDVREAGILLNANFILTGCVQFDRHFRLHVLLSVCETGEQLWGITIDRKDVESIDQFLLQEEIVNRIEGAVNELVNGYCVTENPVFNKAGHVGEHSDNERAFSVHN